MTFLPAIVKRQAETITALSIVLGGLWWIAGPRVTDFIDERVSAQQQSLQARVEADQAVSRETARDAEKIKGDILVINNSLKNLDRQTGRIETKLDNLMNRLIPLREGRTSPPQSARDPFNAD